MIESPYQPSPDRYDDGMVYRRAGRSGVLLPAFSLGMWHNFGSGQAFSNVQRMAHYAFDRGITHFDLANNYGPAYGTVERLAPADDVDQCLEGLLKGRLGGVAVG